jgi:hypothetical protein
MQKTKQQIQDRITELETYVTDANNTAMSYKSEVSMLERELEDLNKPVIDDNTLDKIYEIIQSHVEDINEIDPSECEFNFEIDRDNMVYVDSIQVLRNEDYFAESLYNDLKTLFKVKEKEDEDSV